jgi:hypothetical protein
MKLPRRQFLHLAASAAALPAQSIAGARALTKNHFRRNRFLPYVLASCYFWPQFPMECVSQ